MVQTLKEMERKVDKGILKLKADIKMNINIIGWQIGVWGFL